jgi:hypothetical protein
MDILLIAGLWLDGPACDSVAAQLEARGHRAVPITQRAGRARAPAGAGGRGILNGREQR